MSAMPLRAPAWTRSPAVERRDDDGASRRPAPAPRLRIVRAPAESRTRVPFLVLCVAILAAALLGALLLNTSMAQTSYAIQDRQIALARLTERVQDLQQQVEIAASPAVLAQRARVAGMVPAPAPAFIRLSDGVIIGESDPAEAHG